MNTNAWIVAGAVALAGCSTQDFVRSSIAPVQDQVTGLEKRLQGHDDGLKSLDAGLKSLDTRVQGGDARVLALEKEAQARAVAAGKVREGGLLLSTVLTDDRVKFVSGRAQLSKEGSAELDQLAARLKADNQPVFLEIQGHTDATGGHEFNQRLGQLRADAVRQHLAVAGIPLHRLATVSYGETAPMADNTSAEGRRQNRRVQLVVLR